MKSETTCDVGVVLQRPVLAGDAGVEHAVLDVARHLLRAGQHAAQRVVVDAGKVAAVGAGDLPAGLAEELQGGGFEASLGKAECELGHGVDGWRWRATPNAGPIAARR